LQQTPFCGAKPDGCRGKLIVSKINFIVLRPAVFVAQDEFKTFKWLG
jgi:hypothetical protein